VGGGQPGREETSPSASTAAMSAKLNHPEIEKPVRIKLSSLLTALLLPNPASLQLKCRTINKPVTATDVSDILEFSLPGGHEFALYVDRVTHRPAMISYRLPAPNAELATSPGHNPTLDRRNADAEASTSRVQAFLSDYRIVCGRGVGELWLPHRITWTMDGKTTEDIRVRTFKLNPSLKPKLFEKKTSNISNNISSWFLRVSQ
jgi:hypothetical protein